MSLLIATHRTAFPAVEVYGPRLKQGEVSAMDAAVAVCTHVEDAREDYSVGTGGLPNRDGVVELDGAVMDGAKLTMGAVCSLRGYPHPAQVARRLMEVGPANVLAGQGAADFARQQGFDSAELLTAEARVAYRRWQEIGAPVDAEALLKDLVPPVNQPLTHDTVGVIALDNTGHIVTASSTSGLAFKQPGRVGDTPLPGNGFYADDEVGAAVATGRGEDIMRFSMSKMAVEALAQGMTAQQAAASVMARCVKRCGITEWMGLIVVDIQGNWGAAGSINEFYTSVSNGVDPAVIITHTHI